MVLVDMVFMVDLYYKHVFLWNFLDLFYLHGKNVSIDFFYITREKFDELKTYAKMESVVCKKRDIFMVFDLVLLPVNSAKGSQ